MRRLKSVGRAPSNEEESRGRNADGEPDHQACPDEAHRAEWLLATLLGAALLSDVLDLHPGASGVVISNARRPRPRGQARLRRQGAPPLDAGPQTACCSPTARLDAARRCRNGILSERGYEPRAKQRRAGSCANRPRSRRRAERLRRCGDARLGIDAPMWVPSRRRSRAQPQPGRDERAPSGRWSKTTSFGDGFRLELRVHRPERVKLDRVGRRMAQIARFG